MYDTRVKGGDSWVYLEQQIHTMVKTQDMAEMAHPAKVMAVSDTRWISAITWLEVC